MMDMPTFEEYRDFLIERGLKDCRELLPKKEGTMIPFYKGAIDEFEHCKQIPDIMDMENRYRQLQKEVYQKFRDRALLDDYWYTNGRMMQAEFLFERLKLLYCKKGDTLFARAGIDFCEYLAKKVKDATVH